MPLSAGEKLGPYEIIAPIGKGGMGEVYRAKDTKLEREVAIKVLPAALAQDPERLARFEREAKVLASLNHPNIAQIYGIEESNGFRALVMELVPGQTLKGPLPLETALNYAKQIAEALEAAHEKGITHRDLKPGNIMVTPAGVVKVLDFGLAAVGQASTPGDGNPTNSPTLTIAATQAGMIMGTAGYMSPEQAAGQTVDRRADIWAFGVVLWEMLTGKRLFEGATVSHILASVLKDEPDWEKVPAKVRRLLRSCLEKEVKQRLQAIGDWKLLLVDDGPAASAPAPSPSRLGWVAWGVAALAIVCALGLSLVHFRETSPAVRSIRFAIQMPEGQELDSQLPGSATFAPSPDGRSVVFVAKNGSGMRSLWIRPLDSFSAQRLDKTDGATYPFWSPDSQSIGFFSDGKLKRIASSGGPPLTLCDAPNGVGGTWSREGVIVFAPMAYAPLQRVAAGGGVPTTVTTLDPSSKETSYRYPQFLPDGRRFLYLVQSQYAAKNGIYVQMLGSTERKFLMAAEVRAAFAAPNRMLFGRQGSLFVQNIDPENFVLQGEPVLVADSVNQSTALGSFAFSASDAPSSGTSRSSGGMIIFRAASAGDRRLFSYSRDGKRSEIMQELGRFSQISLSPDDQHVAVQRYRGAGGDIDLWLLGLSDGVFSRLTSDDGNEDDPRWSADSRRIIFDFRGDGKAELRELTLGSKAETLVYGDGGSFSLDDWTRDGRFLVYHARGGETELFVLPLDGERKPRSVRKGPFQTDQVYVSPDGRWVTFGSNESGQWEVYVAAFPSFAEQRQISRDGGVQPTWRKDGKELFFLSSKRQMMAVDVRSDATLETGAPKALFQTSIPYNANVDLYAATKDGQRFLAVESSGEAAKESLNVITNWASGLVK